MFQKFWQKIQRYFGKKFRLVLLYDTTLEPILSARFSRLRLFVFILLFSFTLIASTSLLIAFTSLKQYIPGYGDLADRKKMIQLYRQIDSIATVLYINNLYLDSVMNMVRMAVPIEKGHLQMHEGLAPSATAYIENTQTGKPNLMSFIYRPVDGVVVRKFEMIQGHIGIDIASREGSAVVAVEDAVVLYSGWIPEYGNTVILKHHNNVITVYAHLSLTMVHRGDNVAAGRIIGLTGNTGEHSTGPHLHFELWIDQKPVDPLNYFIF